MKIAEIPLSTASNSRERDLKPWVFLCDQCRISGNLDENMAGFVTVPSGIVGNQLEPNWKHLDYPSPQPQSTANDNIKPGSYFSHIAASPPVDSRWALGLIHCCSIWNH